MCHLVYCAVGVRLLSEVLVSSLALCQYLLVYGYTPLDMALFEAFAATVLNRWHHVPYGLSLILKKLLAIGACLCPLHTGFAGTPCLVLLLCAPSIFPACLVRAHQDSKRCCCVHRWGSVGCGRQRRQRRRRRCCYVSDVVYSTRGSARGIGPCRCGE